VVLGGFGSFRILVIPILKKGYLVSCLVLFSIYRLYFI